MKLQEVLIGPDGGHQPVEAKNRACLEVEVNSPIASCIDNKGKRFDSSCPCAGRRDRGARRSHRADLSTVVEA